MKHFSFQWNKSQSSCKFTMTGIRVRAVSIESLFWQRTLRAIEPNFRLTKYPIIMGFQKSHWKFSLVNSTSVFWRFRNFLIYNGESSFIKRLGAPAPLNSFLIVEIFIPFFLPLSWNVQDYMFYIYTKLALFPKGQKTCWACLRVKLWEEYLNLNDRVKRGWRKFLIWGSVGLVFTKYH